MTQYTFTSESVSEGHPDKLADQISDSILDEILKHDPKARVAAETLCSNNTIVLAGEITTNHKVDFKEVAKKTILDIGYNDKDVGLDGNNCDYIIKYNKQSPDIKIGVDSSFDDPLNIGAGDQGLMFGFAVNETEQLMPYPIVLAHNLVRRQSFVRKNNILSFLRPDAKSQVTLVYDNNKPISIDTIVLSTQHNPDISLETLREAVIEEIIKPVLPTELNIKNIKYLVNPTGRFVVGGPEGDCGLTGRKIIVDTYGGYAPHGGGAFSGKDPTKVDRSGAYVSRWIAKNIVANNLAEKCLIQISYAIGVSKPTSIFVNTYGTNKIPEEQIVKIIKNRFDLRPNAIIETLQLRNPIYLQTASYGHFGRTDLDLPWERVTSID